MIYIFILNTSLVRCEYVRGLIIIKGHVFWIETLRNLIRLRLSFQLHGTSPRITSKSKFIFYKSSWNRRVMMLVLWLSWRILDNILGVGWLFVLFLEDLGHLLLQCIIYPQINILQSHGRCLKSHLRTKTYSVGLGAWRMVLWRSVFIFLWYWNSFLSLLR